MNATKTADTSKETRSPDTAPAISGAGRIATPNPAAGAHAAAHLTNEDATPGAGALPSHANASGKEVDGGAG